MTEHYFALCSHWLWPINRTLMIFPPAKKLLCEKQELTSDLICCLNVTNNCNLPCHSIDLIMW